MASLEYTRNIEQLSTWSLLSLYERLRDDVDEGVAGADIRLNICIAELRQRKFAAQPITRESDVAASLLKLLGCSDFTVIPPAG